MRKKRDVNDLSFAHLTLVLLLHYLVNCRSRTLAIYNNEIILGNTCIDSKKSLRSQNHWKSVKYLTSFIFILRLYVDELKWRINNDI